MKKLLLFLLLFISVERFCYWQTKGFRIHRISAELTHNPDWEFPSFPELENDVDNLLSQDFFFLGHGAQCYAFLSADQTTVLKVFKYPRFRPFTSALGIHEIVHKEKNKSMPLLFRSLKIAYEELREETGLIYLHLNRTDTFHKTLTVWDRIGTAHTLDLDNTQFLLQKRAQLAPEKLAALRAAGNLEEAKQCVDAILAHQHQCCKKGIVDRDPVFERNFGFIGNQAVEIDTGAFSKDPFTATPAQIKKHLFFATLTFKQWIANNYPELEEYLEDKIYAVLAE